MKYKFFFIVVFLIAELSNACDPCALYSALNVNQNTKGSLSLSIFEQLTTFEKGDQDAYYSLKDGERIKNFSTTQFNLSYGVTNDFSLQISVPFIIRHFDDVENFRAKSSTDSGLGDLSLLSQYSNSFSFLRDFKLISSVYFGIKLPTGDTGSLSREQTNKSKHHPVTGGVGAGRILTFGSGSIDFPLGGSVTIVKDKFIIPFGAQYTFRTQGSYDYRFDNDLYWYFNPGYLVYLIDDFSISVNGLLSGENKGADQDNGKRVALSSFSNVFFGPSISFTSQSNLGFDLSYQTRVTDKDFGIIVPEDRLRFALNYRF